MLVDQLFSEPKCVRLSRMSERSYDLLTKIIRAVPKRSEGELQDVVGEDFMRLSEGNVSEFQKKKARGALPTEFPTMDEKDEVLRKDYDGKGTVVGSFRVSDPKKQLDDPWGVSFILFTA